MSTTIDERTILESLRLVPVERWREVFLFVESLRNRDAPIRTAEDLSRSEFVGLWADRNDLGETLDFARGLREKAETRPGVADAPGH